MNTLTPDEQKLVYNIEVLGMTAERAAELCGMTTTYKNVLVKPEVMEARAKLKTHLRHATAITREDVISGLKEAIEMAKLINEPMPMIAGWNAISKLLGYDKPQEVKITIEGNVREMRKQIRALPESELLRLADDSKIIDADFYPLDEKNELPRP